MVWVSFDDLIDGQVAGIVGPQDTGHPQADMSVGLVRMARPIPMGDCSCWEAATRCRR